MTKTYKMKDLTTKELELLKFIQTQQNEEGHSDFLSTDAKSKKNAGIISSLLKKGLIFNSFDGITKEEFRYDNSLNYQNNGKPWKMWVLTRESLNYVETPKNWEI